MSAHSPKKTAHKTTMKTADRQQRAGRQRRRRASSISRPPRSGSAVLLEASAEVADLRLVRRVRAVEALVVSRVDVAGLLLGEVVVVLVAERLRERLRVVVVAQVLLVGGLSLPVAGLGCIVFVESSSLEVVARRLERSSSAMRAPYPG